LLTESGDIDHFIKAANKIVGGFEKRAVWICVLVYGANVIYLNLQILMDITPKYFSVTAINLLQCFYAACLKMI
jgi:hypothetical protein